MRAPDPDVRDLELRRVQAEPLHKPLGGPAGPLRQTVEGIDAVRRFGLLAHLRGPTFAQEFIPKPCRRDAEFRRGLVDADLEDAGFDCVEVKVSILGGFLSRYRMPFAGDVK